MDLAPMVQVQWNTEAEILNLVILTNFINLPPALHPLHAMLYTRRDLQNSMFGAGGDWCSFLDSRWISWLTFEKFGIGGTCADSPLRRR